MQKIRIIMAVLLLGVWSGNAAQKIDVGILKADEKKSCADGIYEALKSEPLIEPAIIRDVTPEALKKYQVLIMPQFPLEGVDAPVDKEYSRCLPIIRKWVEAGGGLMTTHDAVGYRLHEAIFPEVAKGFYHDVATRQAFSAEVVVCRERPFTPSFRQGDRVPLSYFDYVTLATGPNGKILARGVNKAGDSAKSSDPVIAYGTVGQGRYIANGTIPGVLPDGNVIPPSGPEKQLLLDCIKYLAGRVNDAVPDNSEFGAEYYLGDKQANLLFNGSLEILDTSGQPPQVSIYVSSVMLPDWGITDKEHYSGIHSVRLGVKGYLPTKESDDWQRRPGTIGIIFGAVRIPESAYAYEFSFRVKGAATNVRQPEIGAQIYVWKLVDGALKLEALVPQNPTFAVTPDWQQHAVRFVNLGGYAQVALKVLISGTESNIPPQTATGEKTKRTDVPVGTTIYLDDARLASLGKTNLSNLTLEKILADAERRMKAEWRASKSQPVPPLEKDTFGAAVEPDQASFDLPNYEPWPENWEIVDLNGVWKNKKLPGTETNPAQDEGTVQGFWKSSYDVSEWPERSVPGFWGTKDKPLSSLAPDFVTDGKVFLGVGWYRTTFNFAEITEGKRVILYFDRVHYEATVYLNDRKIGVNRGGNRPFEFDVTDAVKPGANVLAVRVFLPNDKYWIDDRGEADAGGIMGDVALQIRPAIYAAALFIDPKIKPSEIAVRAEIMNASGADQTREFKLNIAPSAAGQRLQGRQGVKQDIALGMEPLKPGINELSFSVKLEQPVAWSPDYPYLYDLRLSAGDDLIARERFGFREYATRDQFFLLNGKPFYPKGEVLGFGILGGNVPGIFKNQDNIARRVLAAHKVWGVNMLFPQGMHLFYPRAVYDLCDELGILINEWQGAAYSPLKSTCALFDDDDTVRRFRYIYNHPSIVMFTVGNESRDKEFIAPINHVYDLMKKIDGQKRPVCAVSGGVPSQLRFKEDSCDIHGYYGMFYGHPLDTRAMCENANREVWESHGKALPVGNWEMGGCKSLSEERVFQLGNKLFSAPKLDKEALIQSLVQRDSGYTSPSGMRWLTLYGLRRYCVSDYQKALQDQDFAGIKDLFDKTPSLFVCKYFNEWYLKNSIEDFRRMGNLMRGGFGLNIGRSYSLFYVKDRQLQLADAIRQAYSSRAYFSPWLMTNGILVASELYSNYKRVCNARFICADVFDKNCFAGRKLRLTVYAINDTQDNSEPWKARVVLLDKAGHVLCDQTADIGSVEAMKRNLLDFAYDIPALLPTGFYDLRLYLLQNEKIISDNYYSFFVLGEKDLDRTIAAGSRRIAVYDTSNQKITTEGILKGLGLKFDNLKDFARLSDYDILIIGAESLDGTVISGGPAIQGWLKNGGRLLQFEQYNSNNLSWLPQLSIIKRLGGNVGNLIIPEHPVFDKISADDNWDTWSGRLERTSSGGKQGGIFIALVGPLNKTALAVACQDHPRANDAAVQMLVANVKVGKGVALISQVAAAFRYDVDSVATKYIQNCLKYILSDESRFAEPLSGLTIAGVDYHRCGYLDLSGLTKREIKADNAWFEAVDKGLKSCGDLSFKLAAPRKAALVVQKMEFKLPKSINYMDPEWEAKKQAADVNQGALMKDRIDNLFIMASLPDGAKSGAAVARMTLCYMAGPPAVRELIAGQDIAAQSDASDLENAIHVGNGFYVTRWQAPKADVPVEMIVIETLTDKGLIIGGVTAALVREKIHGL